MRIDDQNDTTESERAGELRPLRTGEVDRVRVKVIGIDRERDRISLSLRQLEADPWSKVGTEVRLGQDAAATITKLMPFGDQVRVRVVGIEPRARASLAVDQAGWTVTERCRTRW